jgi:hypothetical protein
MGQSAKNNSNPKSKCQKKNSKLRPYAKKNYNQLSEYG